MTGYYFSRELDDRPGRRRQVRLALTTVLLAQSAASRTLWRNTAGPVPAGGPCSVQGLQVRGVASGSVAALVWTAGVGLGDKWLLAALHRRDVKHPYRLLGVVVGGVYALSGVPLRLAEAQLRLAGRAAGSLTQGPAQASADPVPAAATAQPGETPAFVTDLRRTLDEVVDRCPDLLSIEHRHVDENADDGLGMAYGWESVLRLTGLAPAQVEIWYDGLDDDVSVWGALPYPEGTRGHRWHPEDSASAAACLRDLRQLAEDLAGPGREQALATAAAQAATAATQARRLEQLRRWQRQLHQARRMWRG